MSEVDLPNCDTHNPFALHLHLHIQWQSHVGLTVMCSPACIVVLHSPHAHMQQFWYAVILACSSPQAGVLRV